MFFYYTLINVVYDCYPRISILSPPSFQQKVRLKEHRNLSSSFCSSDVSFASNPLDYNYWNVNINAGIIKLSLDENKFIGYVHSISLLFLSCKTFYPWHDR